MNITIISHVTERSEGIVLSFLEALPLTKCAMRFSREGDETRAESRRGQRVEERRASQVHCLVSLSSPDSQTNVRSTLQ